MITIKNGTSYQVSCPLNKLYPPEANILVPGDYTVQGTLANYIQDPRPLGDPNRIDLSMVAIKSTVQTIKVYNYTFGGFFSPVDNPEVLNTAKAGQAIPIKWQLKDPNGMGIADPSSFKSLISYKVSCDNFYGDQTDEILADAPGNSTLQYLGNGNWQYNWKTGKNYATKPDGPCRTVVLTLKDGTTHTANFKFK